LNRISAYHLVSNKASARVLAKLGIKEVSVLRQLAKCGSGFEDVVLMASLREQCEELCRKSSAERD
jgi:RimJ/RimL family protein N-acetyltransferase